MSSIARLNPIWSFRGNSSAAPSLCIPNHGRYCINSSQSAIEVIDFESGSSVEKFCADYTGSSQRTHGSHGDVCCDETGNKIAVSGERQGVLHLLKSEPLRHHIPSPNVGPYCEKVDITPNGKIVAIHDLHRLSLFEYDTGRRIYPEQETDFDENVLFGRDFNFSPCGRF